MATYERENETEKIRFDILLERFESSVSPRNHSELMESVKYVKGHFESYFLLLYPCLEMQTEHVLCVCIYVNLISRLETGLLEMHQLKSPPTKAANVVY